MSKKQWLVLLMLFLTYLLLGASIFYHIESELEVVKVREAREHRIEINALLHDHYVPTINMDHHEILAKLTKYCGKSVYNYTENEVDVFKWDFYNSFYFAYTVVSTIGYGNLAPTNMLGRILMIFYGLIGIPMNGILLAQLGEFFGNVFVRAHEKYKSYKDGRSDSPKKLRPLETRRAGLAVQIFMYLTPGFIMFIFFPAFLFSYWEGWQYDEAVYYAFVTLSTVGFGDYVAGQDNTKGSGIFWIAYKIFLIIWISFGLGYLVMIMSFIARGMRSKRITRLEHKLAVNIKQTQSRIWNEFNKDINYLRRVFNEVNLMKLKPVYRDEFDPEIPFNKFPRSCSFPDIRELIYGGLETSGSDTPIHPRRRANSEVAQVIQFEAINRVVSETDLQRIDKKATFASHAMVQPAELLAHLINAMGYMPPSSEELLQDNTVELEQDVDQSRFKGIDGFSDKEILASEKPWLGSGWRIGGEKMPEPRMRAASAIGPTKDYEGFSSQQNSEWTWSGPAASKNLRELIKARKNINASVETDESNPRIMSSDTLGLSPKKVRPRWFNNPFSSKKNSADMSRRDSLPGIDDIETNLRENYLSHTSNSHAFQYQDRRRSAAPHYFTHTGAGGARNLPNTPDGNLLEQTSLADFLRALTALHSRVGAVPEDLINRPQRKMGTASLTPPKLPSLLALFSPPPGFNSQNQSNQSTVTTAGQMASRRFSLRPVASSENLAPGYQRRGSLMTGARPRRFSLRPDDNSGSSTPTYNQRRGSLIPGSRPRRFSLRNVFATSGKPHNTPPYTADLLPLHIQERQNPPPYSADPYVFECPKEPLVSAEVGPAQDGISLPVRGAPVPRRFSLRPAQIGVPPAPSVPKTPTMIRPVQKWKGGMLQRQISELSLQRRVRAFSLGDVHSIKTDKAVGQTSPLALPNATSNLSTVSASSQVQSKAVSTVPSIFVHQTSVGQVSKENRFPRSLNTVSGTEFNKPEHKIARPGAKDFGLVVKDDQKKSDEGSVVSNPFNFEARVERSDAESGKDCKADGRQIKSKPFPQESSHLRNLHSVVVDEPSCKTDERYFGNDEGSLSEVKVICEGVGKLDDDKLDLEDSPLDRNILKTIASSDEDKLSVGSRKISSISQQSTESGSTSNSRKSSTSKSGFEKPRVSIDSYKPLTEVKIEKPVTNPFEQYKATVECKLDKPRGTRSDNSRKTSREMRGDATTGEQDRNSTPISTNFSNTSESESSKDRNSQE